MIQHTILPQQEIFHQISQAPDLKIASYLAMLHICSLSNRNYAEYWQKYPEKSGLQPVAYCFANKSVADKPVFSGRFHGFQAGKGILNEVLQNNEPVHIDDFSDTPALSEIDNSDAQVFRTASGYPVKHNGLIFGVILLFKVQKEEMDQNVLPKPEDITGHLAKVIHQRDWHFDSGSEDNQLQIMLKGVRDYAIFLLDPDGRVASWNESAERIKGFSADEILGKHFSRFYLPEERAAGIPDRQLANAEKKGSVESEGWRIKRDGGRMWANVVITALKNPDGSLRGYLKVTRDMTERKKNERALSFQANILNTVQDAIVATDSNFMITAWNKVAEKEYGYNAEEAMGQQAIKLLKTQFLDNSFEDAVHLLTETGKFRGEIIQKNKEGREILIEANAIAISDSKGNHTGYVSVNRNITHRKQAEKTIHSLFKISEKLNSTVEVDKLLEYLVQETMLLVNASGGFAGVHTPNGMEVKQFVVKDKIYPVRYFFKAGEGLAGWSIKNKLPRIVNEPGNDRLYRGIPDEKLKIESAICVPITDTAGSVIGFFELHNKMQSGGFTEQDKEKLVAVSQSASTAIQNALAFKRLELAREHLRHSQERLRKLGLHIQSIREEERKELAREIHDQLGQDLTGLKMSLYLFRQRLEKDLVAGNSKKELQKLDRMIGLLDRTIKTVRRIIVKMRPALLDDLGLLPALEWQANEFREHFQIECNLQKDLSAVPYEGEPFDRHFSNISGSTYKCGKTFGCDPGRDTLVERKLGLCPLHQG